MDATKTEDATVLEVFDEGCRIRIDLPLPVNGQIGLLDPVLENEILKVTLATSITDGAVEGVIGKD